MRCASTEVMHASCMTNLNQGFNPLALGARFWQRRRDPGRLGCSGGDELDPRAVASFPARLGERRRDSRHILVSGYAVGGVESRAKARGE